MRKLWIEMCSSLAVVIVLLMWGAPAAAQTGTDPELLFISSSTTTFCQGGNVCVINNEVNPISSTFFIDFNGNGQGSVVNPILLLVGIPNGGTVPNINATISYDTTAAGGTATRGGADIYGGTWDPTVGLASSGVEINPFTTGDAYGDVGLNDSGDGSENFGNWASATNAITHSTPTSYTIAVYELNLNPAFAPFSAGNDIDVTMTGLAAGDIVVGYACSSPVTGACTGGNQFSTPFTEAGVVTPTSVVPDGGMTLMLLGGALVGIESLRRRFRA